MLSNLVSRFKTRPVEESKCKNQEYCKYDIWMQIMSILLEFPVVLKRLFRNKLII